MTREERIKSLARLYCHYMAEYHEAQRKLYKAIKEDEETVDAFCAITNVNGIDRICINPILKLLQYEDVVRMERENGRTVIYTRDHLILTIDEMIVGNPFKIEFPIDHVYEDD